MKANWYKISSIAYIIYAFIMPVLVLCLYIYRTDPMIACLIELALFLGLGIITIMTVVTYLYCYSPIQRELSALKEFQENLYSKIQQEYSISREVTQVLSSISNQKHSVSLPLESYINEFIYNVPKPLKVETKIYDKLMHILADEKKENPFACGTEGERQVIINICNSAEKKDANNFITNMRAYSRLNQSKKRTFIENIHPNYIGIIVGLIGAIMAIIIRLC